MSSVKLARRLVEPDYLTGPAYVETYGPLVAEVCAAADFAPDPQQELLLDRIFAIRADGLPAAFSTAVICCRQNLKTGLFKQAALGWIYVTEQQLVVWSAHEMSTALEAQRDLAELIERAPALRRRLKRSTNEGLYGSNGQERIEFESGQRIRFRARTNDGGRGLTGNKVILDEAFALAPSNTAALLPTMMARPEGQVVYGSSAGKADSEVLRDVRDRGRAGSSPRMFYAEWLAPWRRCANPRCAHPKDHSEAGCALDDIELRTKANPTLSTGRITLEKIEDMRQELDPADFARECLGWWGDPSRDGITRLIPVDDWTAASTTIAPPDGVRSFGMVFDFDSDRGALAGAVKHDDGTHLELIDVGPVNIEALAGWFETRWRNSGMIAIAGGGGAKALKQALRDRKVPERVIRVLTTPEYFAGNVMLLDGLTKAKNVTVPAGSDALEASVKVADRKNLPSGWRWISTSPDGDQSPMEALSVALWAARTNRRRPGRKQVIA